MNNDTLEKLQVLLVEDNPVTARMESALLVSGGYNVVTAASGEDALRFMKYNMKIDAVLMDVDLGEGMSGIEAASTIASAYCIPVLFYTGHDEYDLFFSADAMIKEFGYIPKNSSKGDVLEIIRNAILVKKIFQNDNSGISL